MTETATGTDRSAGLPYQRLLDEDSRPVPDSLRRESPMAPGATRVPVDAYTSRAFHDLEVERLWKRVWQLACHEDEIPEVGDYTVYDIAHLSYLVVRTAPDEIRAFRNACLHRGRLLRESPGKGAGSIRCAFHGWCWNLDGTLREIPCEWDFPSVDAAKMRLPEAKLARWHGLVFLNPDPGADSLETFLGDLDSHFTSLPLERRVKVAHVAKVIRCNWKVCQEAFMEAYHVVATHPTLMNDIGDANSQYDVFGHYSRAVSPSGVESPHLTGATPFPALADAREYGRLRHPMSGHVYERAEPGVVHVTDERGEVSVFTAKAVWQSGPVTQADPHLCQWIGGAQLPGSEDQPAKTSPAPPGPARRTAEAEGRRRQLAASGIADLDADAICDAELVDSIYFSVFPNWHPWGAFNPIHYRFRPHGDDPDESIMEVMFFVPAPDPEKRPPPAPIHWLDVDDDWTCAPELGPLAKIFNQDTLNLPMVQRGLKNRSGEEVVLGEYGESKLRHFHGLLARWLGTDANES